MNIVTDIYSIDEIRKMEQHYMKTFAVSDYMLMTRAGQFLLDLVCEHYDDAQTVLVFCGSGKNAGDGYVFANLASKRRLAVQVIQLSARFIAESVARRARDEFLTNGGEVVAWRDFCRSYLSEIEAQEVVIVDAILGTGLSRAVSGDYLQAIEWINQSPFAVIAADVPSGLDANTGKPCNLAVEADVTASFVGPKRGLVTGGGKDYVGQLHFNRLGIPDEVFQLNKRKVSFISEGLRTEVLRPRKHQSYKYSYGHALLIGGNQGMGGAIKLAAEAAARSGAGLVSVGTHPDNCGWLNATRPELMVQPLFSPTDVVPMLSRKDVVLIGPGLSQDKWARDLLTIILNSGLPLVLDADALNLLAKSPVKNPNWILTPHAGEAARLLNVRSSDIESDRYESVKALNKRYGGVTLLKGAGSLVSYEDKIKVCPAGNPGMATAGMGDLLAGIITGLVAQGISIASATQLGVYVHAFAADHEAQRKGQRGMLPSDLLTKIRSLLNP